MFDSIAPRYDLINKVISLGLDMQWRRAMVRGLGLRAGDRVVDMATGTADVAIMISEELAKLEGAPEGTIPGTVEPEVIGIDPSARMLEVGREKVAEAGLSSRVRLQIGDAQDLADIADGSVDKLTMAFGIRNVPDRSKALEEIRRIMATPALDAGAQGATEDAGGAGGHASSSSVVAILELQDPESGLLASATRAFIKYGAPVLGWVMSGNGAEYGHLKNSILRFPSVSEWTALMGDAGKIHLVAPLPPGATISVFFLVVLSAVLMWSAESRDCHAC
ncbi:Ubiquinone/menaquinone biosynthesis methyltransferase ubiE, putative [Ectocarpus siliculosus]|uniref:Ubiquinone/menaquinone biosynthesis methyltransferase ubiE, putative n=1 Tax=Ectocarpus siliculosus TaxID=2880 RepID=D8LTT5_ECTSI|nr:Ubiquinone/menaquinone biosynthesis methyltransferase ubiE, putative [Ectocarpus siliculosus]|eukprot:CBN73982.1 Ubiquinone/menaquinone biosynthesis methyltransferase ubiE, putative [Ectocarpus siliculosus]